MIVGLIAPGFQVEGWVVRQEAKSAEDVLVGFDGELFFAEAVAVDVIKDKEGEDG